MARIRTIKPEAWQSEQICAVSREARLLWVVLLTMVDDDGRMRWRPATVLGHGYPDDLDAAQHLEEWVEQLASSGLVTRYEADGATFIAFPKFSEHQKIARHTPSKFPPPPGADVVRSYVPEPVRRALAKRAGAEPGCGKHPASCVYCGAAGTVNWSRLSSGRPSSWVTFTDLEVDHVVPVSQGGSTTDEANFALACTSCNRSKGSKTPLQWRGIEHVEGTSFGTGSVRDRTGEVHGQGKGKEGIGSEGMAAARAGAPGDDTDWFGRCVEIGQSKRLPWASDLTTLGEQRDRCEALFASTSPDVAKAVRRDVLDAVASGRIRNQLPDAVRGFIGQAEKRAAEPAPQRGSQSAAAQRSELTRQYAAKAMSGLTEGEAA